MAGASMPLRGHVSDPSDAISMMLGVTATTTLRAYLAGFFDGEGCVSAQRYPKEPHRLPSVIIQITQRDRAVLERIQSDLGYGRIHERKNGCHALVITGKTNVRAFIRYIYPYALLKREQLRLGFVLAGLQSTRQERIIPSERVRARRFDIAARIAAANARGRLTSIPNRLGATNVR